MDNIFTSEASSKSAELNSNTRVICRVCEKQISKYKCPRCKIRYCSVNCYKSHSLRCTEPNSNTHLICRVCEKQISKYTCPRCKIRYCSVHCYKSHSPRCTEPNSNTHLICRVCEKQISKYTCPRCKIRYCSVNCYKSHSLRCTESFMKENVMEELHQMQPAEKSKSKMPDIVKRLHDEDEADSLDEEGGLMNFGDLSIEEKTLFQRAVTSGELSKLIQPWDPWWFKPSAKLISLGSDGTQLVQPIANEADADRWLDIPRGPETPLSPVAKLTTSKPSSLLTVNLIDIIYSYCFTLRFYNGDPRADALESSMVALSVSFVLGGGQPQTVSEALLHCLVSTCSPSYKHMGGLQFGRRVVDDVIHLLYLGDNALVCLLCDFQRLFQAGKKEVKSARMRKSERAEVGGKLESADRMLYFVMCWVHEQVNEAWSDLAGVVDMEKASTVECEGSKTRGVKLEEKAGTSGKLLIKEVPPETSESCSDLAGTLDMEKAGTSGKPLIKEVPPETSESCSDLAGTLDMDKAGTSGKPLIKEVPPETSKSCSDLAGTLDMEKTGTSGKPLIKEVPPETSESCSDLAGTLDVDKASVVECAGSKTRDVSLEEKAGTSGNAGSKTRDVSLEEKVGTSSKPLIKEVPPEFTSGQNSDEAGSFMLQKSYTFNSVTGKGMLSDGTSIAVDANLTDLKVFGLNFKHKNYLPVFVKNGAHLIHQGFDQDFTSFIKSNAPTALHTTDLPVNIDSRKPKDTPSFTRVDEKIRGVIKDLLSFLYYLHFKLDYSFQGFSKDNLVFVKDDMYFWKVEFHKSNFSGRSKDIKSAKVIISSLFGEKGYHQLPFGIQSLLDLTDEYDKVESDLTVSRRVKETRYHKAEMLLKSHYMCRSPKERIAMLMKMPTTAVTDLVSKTMKGNTEGWLKKVQNDCTEPMAKCLMRRTHENMKDGTTIKVANNYEGANSNNPYNRNHALMRCIRNLAAHLMEHIPKESSSQNEIVLDCCLLHLFERYIIILQKGFAENDEFFI